ncbi:hypothetical protein [Rhodovulum sulfidophilum]|uniref:hypothetical protein n=1 Tax=Rhodovulum sulfidophilum TaxID=35806 RepID=UPI000952E5AF|nr:hypothetical protein [Rhodovulum sulfidophilum]OLS48449.1 hypothetical protein BV379_09305 [Rhodovulum sulfidophilum]
MSSVDGPELAERLSRIEGAFVLSINDRPEIRDLFGAFVIEEVRLNYSVSKSGATAARELIIANREVRMGLV